jgi:hypothetical protein
MRGWMVILAVLAGAWAPAGGQQVSYTGGLQYATGSYIFTEPTRTTSLSTGLVVEWGRARLTGTIPLVVQSTGWVSLVGGVPIPTGGTGHGDVGDRQRGQRLNPGRGGGSGSVWEVAPSWVAVVDEVVSEPESSATTGRRVAVGDPLVVGALAVYRSTEGFARGLELTATLKAPITDLDSGVGTGEWDWAAGAAAVVALGPVLGFADLAYWWYGDLPDLELRDGVSWAVGAGLPIGQSYWASGLLGGGNRLIDSASAPVTGSLAFTRRLTRTSSVSVMVGTGLTETAPDFMVSLGWRLGVWGSVAR